MAKVKLATKVDSDVLVVGVGISNSKLQILSGISEVDSTALLINLNAIGATGKVDEVIKKYQPDYLFNTGANAYVAESWILAEQHVNTSGLGTLRVLESIRKITEKKSIRFQGLCI